MAQNDVFKRYLDAGLAFTALTQARAEALVKDLVKAGEVQADQAREAVADLIERSRKNSEKLLETVRSEVRAQLSERGVASQADLDKLEARLSGLLGSAARGAKAATDRVGARTSSARQTATASAARAGSAADEARSEAAASAQKATVSAKKAAQKATSTTKRATSTAKKATSTAKKATRKTVPKATSSSKASPARSTAPKKRT